MYFIYLRSIDKRVEVSKEVYDAFYKEAHRIRSKEQYHGRCVCPKKHIWMCDGDCLVCKYHRDGDTSSLDASLNDEGFALSDVMSDTCPTPEEITADRDLLLNLFMKWKELDENAERILSIYLDHPEGISDRKIAEILGIPQRTFAVRIKKIRGILKKSCSK